jgi:WhiB family redox-sensing transcriptional regulator
MPDLLEDDDELCTNCGDAPAADRARCANCLTWLLRNGYDRPTPHQEPRISRLEATLARSRQTTEARLAWLMVPEAREVPLTLAEMLHRPEWHQWAACRGVGIGAFVIANGGSYTRRQLCEDCSVRQECLDTALADPDLVGLWAGTTERERRAMRRQSA